MSDLHKRLEPKRKFEENIFMIFLDQTLNESTYELLKERVHNSVDQRKGLSNSVICYCSILRSRNVISLGNWIKYVFFQ